MRFSILFAVLLAACGSGRIGDDDGGGDGDGDGDGGACVNLQCRQVTCPVSGQTTSLSGTVYTPAGNLPLYNINVYVPNAALSPVVHGVAAGRCDRCDDQLSGAPLVRTTTDTHGHFVLDNVPVGADIPLVIQNGKWRRVITLPFDVEQCVDNPITDDTLTRLPGKVNAATGDDLPHIALTTGGADALECLLRKIGIDQSEFTPESGSGRVNFFVGHNGSARYTAAWNGGAAFSDVTLLSCEGTSNPTNKSVAARQAMEDYTDIGGRVFASHWHNYWIEFGPAPLPMAANFNHLPDLNDIVSDIDTTSTQGAAMAEWLLNVGASTTLGKLPITAAQHTVQSVNRATRLIYLDNNANGVPSVQYLTFNTPLLAAEADQCGKMVLSDIHVSSMDDPGADYPSGCNTTTLLPQEKALIFMLFDISSCVGPPVP